MREKRNNPITLLRSWFRLCPVRHILCALGLVTLIAYFVLRGNANAMAWASASLVRPWSRLASRLTGYIPFSLGEALIVGGILGFCVYFICFLTGLFYKPNQLRQIYRFLMTCATAFTLIYGGFCLLWGVYYYTSDFEAQSGIVAEPMTTEQLETVTRYFTDLANQYGGLVPRDAEGCFAANSETYFAYAPQLYAAVEQEYACLSGAPVPAKRFFFSYVLSHVNFTGFYFPFTAEANINTDSPGALAPSTIGHELAHQRGVAQEDEANFVSVLACLTDGDPVYCYSASLLSYIHLSNALYRADYDAWLENYARLSPGVRADLDANNAYWRQFQTPVSTVSDAVYTGFLHSYGQTLGLQTYGKCVDLLVTYYYPRIQNGNS